MSSSSSIRLYLLRHPQVADVSLCYGRLDVPLAPDWVLHAQSLISSLPEYSVIVSSPAGRCRALAEWLGARGKDGTGRSRWGSGLGRHWGSRGAAGERRGPSVIFPAVDYPAVDYDERLLEMNFGQWEGLPWHQIDREELAWWNTDLVNRAPPGGEALADVQLRVASWLTDLRRRWVGQCVLCITHSGVIRCLLAQATGQPLPQMMKQQVDFLALSELHVDNRNLQLIHVNQPMTSRVMPQPSHAKE